MKIKIIVVTMLILSLAVLSCFEKSSTGNKNESPRITEVTASPTILSWEGSSELTVAASDPDGDELSYAWTCSGGSFSTDETESTVTWQAPNVTGTYTCSVVVSDSEEEANANIDLTVYILADDFSSEQTDWVESFCDSWVASEEAHIKGSSYGYYGTMYKSLYPYIEAEYSIEMNLARVSSASTNSVYGLYTKINDSGTVAMPYLWLTIWPGSSELNWAVMAFLSAGYNSQWVLLASDSKGTSSLVKTSANQWNDISWTIEEDYTLTVKIGANTLYQTNEISAIASQLGRTIVTDLVRLGVRTDYGFEVKADDIYLTKPDQPFAKIKTSPQLTRKYEDSSTEQVLLPDPNRVENMKTFREVLENM